MKILDGSNYLILRFDVESHNHVVEFTADLLDALSAWDRCTRISPVWQVEGFNAESEGQFDGDIAEHAAIAFMGPVEPSKIKEFLSARPGEPTIIDDILISIGCFNVIALLKAQDQIAQLIDFCSQESISLEIWVIDESDLGEKRAMVGEIIFHPASEDLSSDYSVEPIRDADNEQVFHNIVGSIENASSPHAHTLIEFLATSAAIRSRAKDSIPEFSSDLDLVETAVDQMIQANAPQLRESLYTLNAGLSRQASQAFSGTTPIVKTECHFWPHSFLGTGVANYALRNLVRFVSSAMDELKVGARIDALFNVPFADVFSDAKNVLHADRTEIAAFSGVDYIGADAVVPDEDDQSLLPVTYFSSRDGFKNSPLSMSAPILSIAGCNAYAWNLATITHEISHRIVKSKLNHLLHELNPGDDHAAMDSNAAIAFAAQPSDTLKDAALKELVYAMMLQEAAALGIGAGDEFEGNANQRIGMVISHQLKEIEECLVHIFDFYHFYNRDSIRYVSCVWQSLAVIPSIESKFDAFINRTILALGAPYFGNSGDWRERAKTELIRAVEHPSVRIQAELRNEILSAVNGPGDDSPEWVRRKEWLWRRAHVGRLFHLIFKSDALASHLQEESLLAGSTQAYQGGDYSFEPREFSDADIGALTKFTNPIRMLANYCSDPDVNASKSAWILHMLAFNLAERDD